MIKSLSETRTTFKLQSYRGAILGTITVPERWAKFLRMGVSAEFCISAAPGSPLYGDETTLRQIIEQTAAAD